MIKIQMIKGGEATGLTELIGSSIKAASLRTIGRVGSEVLALDFFSDRDLGQEEFQEM